VEHLCKDMLCSFAHSSRVLLLSHSTLEGIASRCVSISKLTKSSARLHVIVCKPASLEGKRSLEFWTSTVEDRLRHLQVEGISSGIRTTMWAAPLHKLQPPFPLLALKRSFFKI
jgi:hypothetical protein